MTRLEPLASCALPDHFLHIAYVMRAQQICVAPKDDKFVPQAVILRHKRIIA
jgi:hypothetical protein